MGSLTLSSRVVGGGPSLGPWRSARGGIRPRARVQGVRARTGRDAAPTREPAARSRSTSSAATAPRRPGPRPRRRRPRASGPTARRAPSPRRSSPRRRPRRRSRAAPTAPTATGAPTSRTTTSTSSPTTSPTSSRPRSRSSSEARGRRRFVFARRRSHRRGSPKHLSTRSLFPIVCSSLVDYSPTTTTPAPLFRAARLALSRAGRAPLFRAARLALSLAPLDAKSLLLFKIRAAPAPPGSPPSRPCRTTRPTRSSPC